MSSEGFAWPAVRDALRAELESRGHAVKGDTYATGGAFYIPGENDLASGVFEFKDDALHAAQTLYKGSWVEGLPPVFAVMERSATMDPEFELLEQMHIYPLLFTVRDGLVVFDDLDQVLAHLIR